MKILFVDDDLYSAGPYIEELRFEGYEVLVASNVKSAIAQAETRDFDVVILDILMSPGRLGNLETQGGFKTGIILARELRNKLPDIRILALTNSSDPEVETWFTIDESVAYARKSHVLPFELARLVKNLVEGKKNPRVFIVHGRDSHTLSELKEFLSVKLEISNLIVLAEQPSGGKTLIEKFEHHAQSVDFVFVLATADDFGRLARPGGQDKPRARQNVVFELGFFLGSLKRSSGRVIVLYECGVELPSDIAGVVYIDISGGVSCAETEIRRELADWIP